eukprot:scaffold34715_cov236-Amphora_coffeaeformis.AAC.1
MERLEYTLAVKFVPGLVEKESPIIVFLRTDGFNPLLAARRLAAYWKYRREIFGERWLLPMTMTGSGCLSVDDINFISTAYNVVFQRTPEDGLLFLLDDTRLTKSDNELVNTRIVFFYATLFTDYQTQVNGATVLFVVQSGSRPSLDLNPEGWRMIRNGLPMKFKQVLVARAHEPQQTGEGQQQLLDALVEQSAIAVQIKLQCFPEIVKAESLEGIAGQLESRGCQKNLVPRCLGGLFDYTQFMGWLRERLLLENSDLFSGGGMVPALTAQPPAENATTTSAAARAAASMAVLPNVSVNTSITSTDGESSSSVQARSSIPPLPGPARKKEAAAESSSSLTTSLITKVSTQVEDALPSGEPLDADAIRKRNALYSRRTYHKRKLEILSLEEQVKELKIKKEGLLRESHRLEALAKTALELITKV